MIGVVSYCNPSRRFALLTPLGKLRDHDIFVHQIQFDLAEIELPFVGMVIAFSVTPDVNGRLEATDIQIPNSDDVAAGVNGRKADAVVGASPAAGLAQLPVAGNSSGVR